MSVAWNLNKNSGLRAAVLRDCEVTCEIVFFNFFTKLENTFQMAFVYLKTKLGHKPAVIFFLLTFFFLFLAHKHDLTHEQPPMHAGPSQRCCAVGLM